MAFLVLRLSSDEELGGAPTNGPGLKAIGLVGYLAVVGFVPNYVSDVTEFVL